MKNRNPIISFLLSLFFSGLGQVYNGEIMKGILLAILIFPIYILIGLTGLVSSFNGMILICSVIIIYKLIVSIEAYRRSKSLNPYELRPINHISKYMLFILFGFAVNWIGVSAGRVIIGYESFEIPTPSMEPTINVGDRIMAIRINSKNIESGDVVTFAKEDGQKYLSRVIGLPGDSIEIINDRASINGKLEEWKENGSTTKDQIEYQKYKCKLPNGKEFGTLKMLSFNGTEITPQEISNKELIIVPKDRMFVLGDNRNNSMDSRMYGTIPVQNLEKKVHYVWWSNNKLRIGELLNE
jgi:signal peptidase I